jgi:putative transposase
MARKHNRRSIRLRGYDYASAGAYFVTLNIKHRTPLLGSIRDGEMRLSEIGRIVQEEWLRTPDIRPEVVLDEFLVMPDHMHMIVWIRDVDEGRMPLKNVGARRARPLGNIIRGFKGSVSRRIQNENVGADRIRPSSDGGACDAPRRMTHDIEHEGACDAPRRMTHDIEREGACDAPRHTPQQESIWQRNYYERIVRDEHALRTIRDYIIDNPKKG